MMRFFYDILVYKASIVLRFLALFSGKLNLFVSGRKETFAKLQQLKGKETVWFHAASLGEFEQAIPLIEELKKSYSHYKILVTFFSPSGYEIRKNYPLADVICYLPLDTRTNTRKFIQLLQPKLAIFIKYEFWPNFLYELKHHRTPTILVSGILRERQSFFKWYGGFMRKSLHAFDHFFLQNKSSVRLLQSIGFENITLAGDTRFDRVSKILNQDNSLDFINEFKNNQYTIVAGSTWAEGEALLTHYINHEAKDHEKIIIAPHTMKPEAIERLKNGIHKKVVLYSEKEGKSLKDYQVFILDTIGILTKIYAIADVAYVGGGLRTGLHNILEPATFGIPVVIGNQFSKFQEAVDLVERKGCYSIKHQNEFSSIFVKLRDHPDFRQKTGEINKRFIQENLGAATKIMDYLKTRL